MFNAKGLSSKKLRETGFTAAMPLFGLSPAFSLRRIRKINSHQKKKKQTKKKKKKKKKLIDTWCLVVVVVAAAAAACPLVIALCTNGPNPKFVNTYRISARANDRSCHQFRSTLLLITVVRRRWHLQLRRRSSFAAVTANR
jgi:lipopolysaccharide/colanic/teichoic acid biosynthesis glycosyltransferase